MDHVEILKSKPHNPHYLMRYIKLINYAKMLHPSALLYSENHHICPKAKEMFPEYKSFAEHRWNKCRLPYRIHLIAHYLLMKAYNNKSMALSYIFTTNQKHNSIKIKNSRAYDTAKKLLSNATKGKFTRGYDENGVPIVSAETKKKLSQIKTEYYSNADNRQKQSIACKGTTGRKSEKYSEAAKNRTESHNSKISLTASSKYKELGKHGRRMYKSSSCLYITPVCIFSSIHEIGAKYSKNCFRELNIHSVKNSAIFDKTHIGNTPLELGFFCVVKGAPGFEQLYEYRNQGYPLEPSHSLASVLNDHLSREEFPLGSLTRKEFLDLISEYTPQN